MIKGRCKWNFCGNILARMDTLGKLRLLVSWKPRFFWNKRRATTKSGFWNSLIIISTFSKRLRKQRTARENTIQPQDGQVSERTPRCVHSTEGDCRGPRGGSPDTRAQVVLWLLSGVEDAEGLTNWCLQGTSSVKGCFRLTIYLPARLSSSASPRIVLSPLLFEVFALPGESSFLALLYIQGTGPRQNARRPCCRLNGESYPAAGDDGDSCSKALCQRPVCWETELSYLDSGLLHLESSTCLLPSGWPWEESLLLIC